MTPVVISPAIALWHKPPGQPCAVRTQVPGVPGELVLVRNRDTGREGYVVLRELFGPQVVGRVTQWVWSFTETGVVRDIGHDPDPPTRPLITDAEWADLRAKPPKPKPVRKRKARAA